jgi:hypothetical protein
MQCVGAGKQKERKNMLIQMLPILAQAASQLGGVSRWVVLDWALVLASVWSERKQPKRWVETQELSVAF